MTATVRVKQSRATTALFSRKGYDTRTKSGRKLTTRKFQRCRQLLVLFLLLTLLRIQSSTEAFSPLEPPSPSIHGHHRSTRRRTMTMSCIKSTKDDPSHQNKAKTKTKRPLYSFVEARRIARGHGFSTVEEFLDYDCPGAYQVPKNPNEIWPEEFTGWDDFLGLPISTLQEAKDVLRSSPSFRRRQQRKSSTVKDDEGDDGNDGIFFLITTKEEYMQLFHDKLLDEDSPEIRLPYRPDLKFKEDWVSWDDYLLH